MLKSMETTGRTEEDAIAKALEELGLERDDVSVEVISRAKSGFLGLGSSPARIRVSYEAPDEPAVEEEAQSVPEAQPEEPAPVPAEEEKPEPAQQPEAVPEVREEPAQPEEESAAPAAEEPSEAEPEEEESAAGEEETGEDSKAEKIRQFLEGLMEQLGVDAKPVITRTEDGDYKVDLVGKNLGAVIGRRGETLDAIQQLTGHVVNRGGGKWVRVHIDAENYRAKREESLQRLAVKMADRAVRERRNMTLEPMNAYERHVIHTALQSYPDVTTYSVGTEPNRRTVVAYEPGIQK